MDDFVMPLMLGLDVSSLTMSLVNIASASGAETALADSVEMALRTITHLDVDRVGDTVIARTDGGHAERVVVAGHLDTASLEADPLAYVEMGKLFGPGASDAKGALAMTLKAAAAGGYSRDVTFVYYANGRRSEGSYGDDLLRADFALLAEPTDSAVVGGAHGLTRFASLGIPTVAFGPGDPSVAGTPGEFVATAQLTQCEFVLRQWLTT